MQKVELDWQEPIKLAQKISDNYKAESWIFLHSGLHKTIRNSYSYIALFPNQELITDNFFAAERILRDSDAKWFGYLSYELGQEFEKLPKSQKSFINLPKIWLINFALIFEFDHEKKILNAVFSDKKKLDEVLKYKAAKQTEKIICTKSFSSNFSDESYLKTIKEIRGMIANGDFYQTNLTRKFFGNFTQKLEQRENFQLFTKLTKSSPANYSSFLKLGKNYIISSSPELFLEAKKNGKIISRPIKGTAPRGKSAKEDKENKSALKNSEKDRAENLMIVDLVRNDLARVCKVGSVKVENLFAINSYKNVHHLSSEIHGKIAENSDILDVILACFPAGSMTGAPKIKAMEIASKKEKVARGIYSGAIGFIDLKGDTNLSVVIRTLVSSGNKFEFQAGGAITFDSDPEAELREVFDKIRLVRNLLRV